MSDKVVEFIEQTPAGIEVLYQAEPKRLYKLRSPERPDGSHNFDWFEVPSVTTVLEALDKPGLPWWGMTIGVEGVLALHQLGRLPSVPYGQNGQSVLAVVRDNQTVVAGTDDVVDLLTQHQLTVNHVKKRAGDRGTAVHDSLEARAASGDLPDPSIFPPSEQGYVKGVLAFLTHLSAGEPEVDGFETMVGSLQHGYAGRYDLRVRTNKPCQVVSHRTPVRGAQWAELPAGLFLLDLKTSKDVYPKTHFRQLEAYEGASVECGYEATAARGVIKVWPDGTYKLVRSTAKQQDFLDALAVWKGNQGLK